MLFEFDDPEATPAQRARARASSAAGASAAASAAAGDAATAASAPEGSRRPPARPDPGQKWFFGTVGLLLGLGIALVAWIVLRDPVEPMTEADVDAVVARAFEVAADEPTTAAAAYDLVAPSLVVVRALDGDTTGSAGASDSADSNGSTSTNLGGGVVINDRGQILTANHVVEGAASLEVTFANGTTAAAQIVATTPENDIAVLEAIGATGSRPPAVMGNPRTLQVGDTVFAVGNPLGLTRSMSQGIVSGLNRNIPFPGEDGRVFEGLIQFDAAVNQGSSGGPLLNAQGQVVGIVTALADPSSTGYFIGIGFAVPIDIAAGGAADGPSQ